MKNINNWIAIVCIIASSCFSFMSCSDEVENTQKNNNRTVQLTLSAPANGVISPMTKGVATSIDETIKDLCVLIYDESGNIKESESFYRSSIENDEGLSDIQDDVNGHTYYLHLEDDKLRTVVAVANVGDKRREWENLSDIAGSYGLDNSQLPKCILYAEGVPFSSADKAITAELKRIYAKITVVVDASGVKGATIIPSKVSLKNIPLTGSLAENKIKNNPGDEDYLADGGSIELTEIGGNKWGSHEEGANAFFMYENMQPDGFCLPGDQKSKTPASIGQASTSPSTVKNDKTCSYIELKTKYNSDLENGSVTYRFFLGKDVFKNFEVERNYHYKVTLQLTGEGGIDEASWRVEADIQGKFTPHDAYVGYLVNSESKIYIDGGGYFIRKTWSLSHQNGTNVIDLKSDQLSKDANGYYLAIKSRETNISDRNEHSGTYQISVDGIARYVKVTQVRRILEPIGYYRNHGNNYLDNVVVKEFDETTKEYIPLVSVGPWSAEIIAGGNWFTIIPTRGTEYVGEYGTKVSGNSGAIKFDFQPNGNDNKTTANYGCILVKYHNQMCEHRIFVRQGYEDTDLGDKTYWRATNTVMKYPTMSGALYQGGINKTISPYNPGFNSKDRVDNWTSNYFNISPNNWNNRNSDFTDLCPKGYHVPHIKAYSYIRQQCYDKSQGNLGIQAFIGYVHDDSDERATFEKPYGWEWKNKNASITSSGKYDYECNPAKGTILVKDDGSYTNIFFPFGKGILDHDSKPIKYKKYADYETTINEIGVGRRETDGILNFEELENSGYGATYWSGTNALGTNFNHMLYCRFWSLLKQNIPFYVSDGSDAATGENYWDGFKLYWSSGSGYHPYPEDRGPIGQNRFDAASFVRCVSNKSKQYTEGTDYNN